MSDLLLLEAGVPGSRSLVPLFDDARLDGAFLLRQVILRGSEPVPMVWPKLVAAQGYVAPLLFWRKPEVVAGAHRRAYCFEEAPAGLDGLCLLRGMNVEVVLPPSASHLFVDLEVLPMTPRQCLDWYATFPHERLTRVVTML